MDELCRSPIGIYDSGIGGLTVARAISRILPHEDIIYFGDTAHFPYGEKSEESIKAYSVKIVNILLKRKCKAVIIACHSASSVCSVLLKEHVGNKACVINVVDPMIEYLSARYSGKSVGVIGTKRTIQSKVYHKKIKKLDKDIIIKSLATPLLAPMIEEGFFDNEISHEVIHQYLSHSGLSGIACLVLACTHYPLIKNEISLFFKHNIPILDSSEIVASSTVFHLKKNKLVNTASNKGSMQFFVSDYTSSFEASTRLFFGKIMRLKQWKGQ